MAKVVFINKNRKLVPRGETRIKPGQIYYKGVALNEVVDKFSYVPFFLYCLLGSNGSQDQVEQLEQILTIDLSHLIDISELKHIAQIPGESYSKIAGLVNYIGGKYETGLLDTRINVLRDLHQSLGLFDTVAPTLATAFLILNALPKLYALIDGREPYHKAKTFIESFFVNVLGKDPNKILERDLIVWDTYLVSVCTHGLTAPSYHGFRVTANVRSPFTTALNAWLAGARGDLHFGSIDGCIKDLNEVERRGITHTQHIKEILENGLRVNGYGHRFHPRLSDKGISGHRNMRYSENLQTDPRIHINFGLWRKLGYDKKYTKMVRKRAKEAFTLVGCANVDTMAAGLYLDLGLKQEHALLGPFIARIPHLTEIYINETLKTRPNNYIGLKKRK